MKTIKIKDKRVLTLLQDKDALVTVGRKISDDIEKIEKKITVCENKEKKITANRQNAVLGNRAEELKTQINALIKEFEAVASDITVDKLSAIPKELEKTHKDLMKAKEDKEQERNKIALKVQKIKDRVIPIIHKEVKPQLVEYEDIQTAEIVKGEVVVKIYSKLEEWKEAYQKKNMV